MENRGRVLVAGLAAALGIDMAAIIDKASKEDRKPERHELSSKDYRTDHNGSIRRTFQKSVPKKVRSKARRLAKRKAAMPVATNKELAALLRK